jgi:hypothetical protein
MGDRSRGLGDNAGSQARRSSRASPRAARGKLLRVHRDHEVLVEFAGEHDEGLRRVFDIQIARIGTEHLACCDADDHHVRPGLDPMLVRAPFGMCADLAKDVVAGLTGNSEWRLDVLDNFGKPVFRVRHLAESLEEAAGFKTVSAETPASG